MRSGKLIATNDIFINHKNGNKTDDSITNLELVTQSKNNIHRFRDLNRAPVKGNTKITQEIAEQIRIDRQLGMKYKELMFKYNLSKSSISCLINYKTWK